MRFLFTTLLAACCYQAAFSQSNFEPGAVILISGDTLKGEIDNRDWQKNPDRISHKGSGGTAIEYTPLSIRSFYLTETGEWYDGAIVSVDKTSLKPSDVLRNINARGVSKDTVFLRRLTKGRITLYSLTDEFSRLHLLVSKGGAPEELKLEMKRVLTPKEGIIPVERYKGQLAALTADCANTKFNVAEVKYTEKAVHEIVRQYNKCFATPGDATEDEAEISGFDFTLSLVVAANATQMHHEVVATSFSAVDRTYGPEIMPVGGIGAELIFPRNRRSWSLSGDLIYRYYSLGAGTLTFKTSQLKLSTLVRYSFALSDDSRPFVGIGLTTALALSYDVPYAEYRTLEKGLAAEAGYKFKRISGWLRYERADGFSPYIGVATKFNNWYLGVSYRLTK